MEDSARSVTLLVKSGGAEAMPEWQAWFREFAPGLKVRWWDDPGVDPGDVDYVLVWEPDAGRLATFPNLRLIFSSGAGVDHILQDPAWPVHIPIVRMSTQDTEQRMAEFVLLAVLMLLKDVKRVFNQQAAKHWDTFDSPRSALQTRVGILGLGNLGSASAVMLNRIGFVTAGWSRSPKHIPGVESFAGEAGLTPFLARTDILVCLLPQTPQTQGIICRDTMACLPAGAAIVNVGRGAHVRVPDLLAALDAGYLQGAVLDVFDEEPLPPESPLWTHPKVIVTPHIGADASRRERARYVAEVIQAHRAGGEIPNVYDVARGY